MIIKKFFPYLFQSRPFMVVFLAWFDDIDNFCFFFLKKHSWNFKASKDIISFKHKRKKSIAKKKQTNSQRKWKVSERKKQSVIVSSLDEEDDDDDERKEEIRLMFRADESGEMISIVTHWIALTWIHIIRYNI